MACFSLRILVVPPPPSVSHILKHFLSSHRPKSHFIDIFIFPTAPSPTYCPSRCSHHHIASASQIALSETKRKVKIRFCDGYISIETFNFHFIFSVFSFLSLAIMNGFWTFTSFHPENFTKYEKERCKKKKSVVFCIPHSPYGDEAIFSARSQMEKSWSSTTAKMEPQTAKKWKKCFLHVS